MGEKLVPRTPSWRGGQGTGVRGMSGQRAGEEGAGSGEREGAGDGERGAGNGGYGRVWGIGLRGNYQLFH